ncbi:MAG: hypothetical protein KatS3mg130_1622 [Candidatus Sumerlaea sp.]|nr:MAG: hypothetical protein KatS3mg130_1622 [Candidatus Sumerlaea sp.]
MSVAFVHVDLDDVWALGECYGFPVPEDERHWVYRDGLPRFVEIFREFGIKATFFVVGADAEQSLPAAMLRDLTATGHRLANHSYSHNLRLRSLEETAIREEVRRAHEAIHASTGIKPIGFRAPGYGISKTLLQVLTEQGYRYDSSLMPTPIWRSVSVAGWTTSQALRYLKPTKGAVSHVQRLPYFAAPLSPHR